MGLVVIIGGLSEDVPRRRAATSSVRIVSEPGVADVEAEAERRLAALNMDRWIARKRLTGQPVPTAVTVKSMEISFVARSLCRLARIPMDFDSDVYWPK